MTYRNELINELNDYVAEQIHKIRINKCMTQSDVATKLGISRQAYGKYENKLCYITLPLLSSLTDIFHVSLSAFLPPECCIRTNSFISNTLSDIVDGPYYASTEKQETEDNLLQLFYQLPLVEQENLRTYMHYKAEHMKLQQEQQHI